MLENAVVCHRSSGGDWKNLQDWNVSGKDLAAKSGGLGVKHQQTCTVDQQAAWSPQGQACNCFDLFRDDLNYKDASGRDLFLSLLNCAQTGTHARTQHSSSFALTVAIPRIIDMIPRMMDMTPFLVFLTASPPWREEVVLCRLTMGHLHLVVLNARDFSLLYMF